MIDLTGRVALVTGGASGIGFATAREFADAGAFVIVADRDEGRLATTIAELNSLGGECRPAVMDVSDADQCVAAIQQTTSSFGRLDYAFNNAGINELTLFRDSPPETHELSADAWRKIISVNLDGVFHCLAAEIPIMLAQGGGAIVNTASIQGSVSFPRTAAYTASKHGVLGLTRTIAREYGSRQIRCNAISPGVVDTPLTQEAMELGGFTRSDLVDPIPLGRMSTPDEIARTVVWLCSDGASYVNGANLLIDGGMLS